MHKRPVPARFPHSIALAVETGKPLVYVAVEEVGAPGVNGDLSKVGIVEMSLGAVGPAEWPYIADELIHPGFRLEKTVEDEVGITNRALGGMPKWPEFWETGAWKALTECLVVGVPATRATLAAIDRQLARFQIPAVSWDWVDLLAFYRSNTDPAWSGSLVDIATALGVDISTSRRRTTRETVLTVRVFERLLANYGTVRLANARRTGTET